MRPLRLAATFLAAVLSPLGWSPDAAAPVPTFALSSPSAAAGQPEIFVITRASGGNGAYVLFQTYDGSAKAGVDYSAVHQLVYVKAGVQSVKVSVPTLVNAAATGALTFTAAIASTATPIKATASIMEPAPPPPPPSQWVSAPLQDGNFARVRANDSLWDMTGPGAGRHLVPGEIVAVYFNGWGYQADGQASFAIYALSDGTSGRALASDLEGVAPVGTPPGLPPNWWVPGLVKATKTCASATLQGQPGVVGGAIYRAAMVAGTHMKLADGQTSSPSIMWEVFGVGDQNAPNTTSAVVVTGDCLIGISSAAP